MRWRMVLEVVGAGGGRQVHEVSVGGHPPGGDTVATLGLTLEGGQAILAESGVCMCRFSTRTAGSPASTRPA